MAKFKFRFEQMLNISEKLKDQKQIEFGKAIQHYELQRQKLEETEYSLETTVQNLKNSVKEKITPRQVFEFNAYINKLKNDIIIQKENVDKANRQVEILRTELNKALMEIKKYEKLKEKDLEYYIEEAKQKENAFVDEIVTYKYSQKED